jgi:hypothetical protein
MVRVVEPVLPDPPELLLLFELPHAATPNASATVRQLDAATERTRKRFPPQGTNTKVARAYTGRQTRFNAWTIKPALAVPGLPGFVRVRCRGCRAGRA